MSSAAKKRVTVKLKRPNPLFETWLTEWLEEAKAKESKMQYCFKKALDSLKKYPLPLETGQDCKLLQGFGPILCKMLDDKLATFNEDPNDAEKVIEVPEVVKRKQVRKKKVVAEEIKEVSPYKEYLPKYQSGPYAILVALYQNSLKPEYKGFLTKEEIISDGKFICEKSFTKPEPGTFYTAWSSMKTLLEKNLVNKKGKPAKFSLTDQGLVVAHKLYRTNLTDEVEQKKVETVTVGNKENDSFEDIICLDDDFDESFENLDVSKEINDLINKKEIRLDVADKKSNTKGSRSKLSRTKSTQSEIETETVILTPDTFDIILLVDTAETSGVKQAHDDPVISDLLHLGVNFEIRHLKVGDYVCICRDRQTNFELVLPYVIERKRMDDFASSIKDGRYHEQKFRLKKCGVQNVTYLVESFGKNEQQYCGLPHSTLMQAATNTLVQDGFQVKFCDNSRSTAHYLNAFTKILNRTYKSKTLMSCPKSNLEKSTVKDDLIPLLTFKEFTKIGTKHKTFTVKEMFIKHLLQLKGLSIDKALAIVEIYPTAKTLKVAFDSQREKAELLLANVQFGKNNKKIGPVISRAIYQLYTKTSFT